MERRVYNIIKYVIISDIFLSLVLLIEAAIGTGNWMANCVYVICGLSQLAVAVLMPLRTRKLDKESDRRLILEIFIQHNWIILALGMSGAFTYLAPFVAASVKVFAYVAFTDALLTMLIGIFAMFRVKKLTGIELLV